VICILIGSLIEELRWKSRERGQEFVGRAIITRNGWTKGHHLYESKKNMQRTNIGFTFQSHT
jgi:hypothetical protein